MISRQRVPYTRAHGNALYKSTITSADGFRMHSRADFYLCIAGIMSSEVGASQYIEIITCME